MRSRSSYDLDPVMMIPRDPYRVMIQIQQWWSRSSDDVLWWSRSSDDPDPVQWWWSRSSDDPDPVMLIQIERWSKFSDDFPWWSRSSDDDPDREMIQIQRMKMTWRLRRLKMQMTRWSSWYREEDQCWKLCQKNTFLVKRECWCICNFRMYSYMYFMYCNPMFIPGCIYYVFETCCHAPIFRSGGSIM